MEDIHNKFYEAYLAKSSDYKVHTQHLNVDGTPKFINHLILESSPYLLQHAHNPVNWHTWDADTLNKAKRENKLIFLSIGYATCHWCHVMEKESFDDLEVAKLLNKHFISIKVDREVRPDIDDVFMTTTQLVAGQGGWPLNVFLTPDAKMFFGGTYFPKAHFLSLLAETEKIWQTARNKVYQQSEQIQNIIEKNQRIKHETKVLSDDIMQKTSAGILARFDNLQGGFGQAPKFPHETMLLFLLDAQKRNPTIDKENAVKLSLKAMAQGGLYDVVGGGFHRYATDNDWLVPHFEKMLYNQAQLATVYAKAYALTQIPFYKRITTEILDYVLREMRATNGGFYSATDADSAGGEGIFFIWGLDEIKTILNADTFLLAQNLFDFSQNTLFEDKHIIRYRDINLNPKYFSVADNIKEKLYAVREQREKPLLDDKILLSWNAMMAKSFLQAGIILKSENYINTALETFEFLKKFRQDDGQLKRVLLGFEYSTDALLEDYAQLIDFNLSVFDYTNKPLYLKEAAQLMSEAIHKFWDSENYGFFLHQAEHLYLKLKHAEDGALASSNALMFHALIRLYHRSGDELYQDHAQKLLSYFAHKIEKEPHYYTTMMIGINDFVHGELDHVRWAYGGKIRVALSQDTASGTATYKNNIRKNIVSNNIKEDTTQNKISRDNQPLYYTLTLSMPTGWHVNSSKPKQADLVATKIKNLNSNWELRAVHYPEAEYEKIALKDEGIAVYKNEVLLRFQLLLKDKMRYSPIHLSLTLQACNTSICLAPSVLTFK